MLQRHQRFAAVLSCLADAAACPKAMGGPNRHVALLQLLGRERNQGDLGGLCVFFFVDESGCKVKDVCIFLLEGIIENGGLFGCRC